MTTPTNTPDPVLPPLPEALVRVEGMPRYMAGELRDYGRACYDTGYAQARADLIAELRPVMEEAAEELRACAAELEACHTIGGEWTDDEVEARMASTQLRSLADALIIPEK